ncbi:MAG TPA: hypothetical protein VG605_04995 [Puia sp.]|jgi:hypothetical protein|nr:hypothetical protein [Puia sp.]
MSIQTCICLQAQSDFSKFWFSGMPGALVIELSFVCHKTNVYDLTIERGYLYDETFPTMPTQKDIDALLHAVVQVLELYTAKYPDRTVRCKPGDRIQSLTFRILLLANHDILCPLFTIQEEGKGRLLPFGKDTGNAVFLVKRKPGTQNKPQSTNLTLNTFSELFGNPVHVRLCEGKQLATG